jgi:hypothetical protein
MHRDKLHFDSYTSKLVSIILSDSYPTKENVSYLVNQIPSHYKIVLIAKGPYFKQIEKICKQRGIACFLFTRSDIDTYTYPRLVEHLINSTDETYFFVYRENFNSYYEFCKSRNKHYNIITQ